MSAPETPGGEDAVPAPRVPPPFELPEELRIDTDVARRVIGGFVTDLGGESLPAPVDATVEQRPTISHIGRYALKGLLGQGGLGGADVETSVDLARVGRDDLRPWQPACQLERQRRIKPWRLPQNHKQSAVGKRCEVTRSPV